MKITAGSCVACGACVSACPQKCISIKKDDNGFYKPYVDTQMCLECESCRDVCPVNNRPEGKDWQEGTYYALWANDKAQRMEGSSGGAFGLIADMVLEGNGEVFGAAYSDDMKSVYQTSSDCVELKKLKKSKYVESYTGDIFIKVKDSLEKGRKVFYCGTSCQIDGLKNYLGKDYENLLTCDFLCHGVPSAGIYQKYITNLESRYGKVSDVDFRSKAYGWKAYCSKVTFESGNVYLKTKFQDPYLRLFFENNVLRDACYQCRRTEKSNADITIGDFWKASESSEVKDTNEGISLVGVHTQKGSAVIAQLIQSNLCTSKKLPESDYAYAYKGPTAKPENRDKNLSGIINQDDLFRLPLSFKSKLKGYVYLARAILQK